jgi:hypothetical protein
LQLRADRIDVVRRGRLLVQGGLQPVAVRDFRRALQCARDILPGFVETSEVDEHLRTRQQRRRIIRISASRLVQEADGAFRQIHIAQVCGDRDEQRDRDARQRLQAFHALQQRRHGVEGAQPRNQFCQHLRRRGSGGVREQRMFATEPVMAGERIGVRKLHEDVGIARTLAQHRLVGRDGLRKVAARGMRLRARDQRSDAFRIRCPCHAFPSSSRTRNGSSCCA